MAGYADCLAKFIAALDSTIRISSSTLYSASTASWWWAGSGIEAEVGMREVVCQGLVGGTDRVGQRPIVACLPLQSRVQDREGGDERG